MDVIHELTEIFKKFPGVGPRQAERFVYHLLRQPKANLAKLTELIPSLVKTVSNCAECRRFFMNEKGATLCKVCADKNRDKSKLIVVARDSDLESIEKSGNYNGLYFVLGGTMPILEKDYDKFIRIKDLKGLIKNRKEKDNLAEVILALNVNPEGENTEKIIKKELAEFQIKVSVLGRGLSTGTELEYSDSETIKNALENRK